MELALLAAGSLGAYLLNQQQREAVFEKQNDVPVSYIANQYKPFNDPNYRDIVGCTGSYPSYVDPRLLNKDVSQIGLPYGYNSDPNYINYINQMYYHQTPYTDLYNGPPGGFDGPNYSDNPLSAEHAFARYAQTQERKMNEFQNMVRNAGLPSKGQGQGQGQGSQSHPQKENFQNGNFASSDAPIQLQTVANDYNEFIPSNDPTSDFLLDISNRPISDFSHNNMVPFFGAKSTQNMAGTGVQSGNYIDGVNVNSGYDYTTPLNSTLSNYTGLDDTYLHKREAGPLYSPAEQQTGWVYGTPLFRPELSRYENTLTYRNDLAPTEPIMVGPGLNLDPSIPAAGGFHEFTRVLDNNVNDYKANQLEGRVNMGKFVTGAELPTAYPGSGTGPLNAPGVGVPKNKPDSFWAQDRRPTMTSWAAGLPNADYLQADWNIDKRPNNAQREQTSYGYGSLVQNVVQHKETFSNSSDMTPSGFCLDLSGGVVGVGPVVGQSMNTVRDPTYMSMDNNIRSVSDNNSQPWTAPSRPGMAGPQINNYYVNETDRGSIGPTMVEQLNLVGPRQFNNLSYLDGAKTTMKETTEFAYTGDPSRPDQGSTFWTADDLPKTTTKETTEFAYTGDPSRPDQGSTFWTADDLPKTTMKETNTFSYAGDPSRPRQGTTSWKAKDLPKPTIKGSTNFSYAGSIAPASITQDTSRFQFTGIEVPKKKEQFANLDINDLFKNKIKIGGADTFTIKGSTLVKDFFPGAGRMNIRQDPDYIIGKYSSGTFGVDESINNGPGTLLASLPDGSRFQNSHIMAVPHANPNKLMNVDDRQIAGYQVEQLHNNPLSIYTTNPDGKIPNLYADNKPDDFSTMVQGEPKALPANATGISYEELLSSRNSELSEWNKNQPVNADVKKSIETNGLAGPGAVQVYPKNGNVNNAINDTNANESIVFNSLGSDGVYNPLIAQGSSRKPNENPTFSGHAYSGSFENQQKIPKGMGGPNEPEVYGSTNKKVPRMYNDVGIPNKRTTEVCVPNPALKFANSS